MHRKEIYYMFNFFSPFFTRLRATIETERAEHDQLYFHRLNEKHVVMVTAISCSIPFSCHLRATVKLFRKTHIAECLHSFGVESLSVNYTEGFCCHTPLIASGYDDKLATIRNSVLRRHRLAALGIIDIVFFCPFRWHFPNLPILWLWWPSSMPNDHSSICRNEIYGMILSWI